VRSSVAAIHSVVFCSKIVAAALPAATFHFIIELTP
jgi:hypothetical protein